MDSDDPLLRAIAAAPERSLATRLVTPGSHIGDFRILSKLGAGGMGVVYRAEDERLHREVARLLEPKGSPPASLHNIAATATRFCSEPIRSRFQKASVSTHDMKVLAKEDQARTEQRAFAIGLELREGRKADVARN